MLPPLWQTMSYLNPIVYMINALRHAMIGYESVSMSVSMSVICILIALLTVINLWLLKKGVGLRE